MGRFVRPLAGVGGGQSGVPIRLLDPDGRIVGIGALDGRRIAPAKMLAPHHEPGGRTRSDEPAPGSVASPAGVDEARLLDA
jgi:hypothetical protein